MRQAPFAVAAAAVFEVFAHRHPRGIGRFLAMRFKEAETDHKGWAKEIWDMAAAAWLLDPDCTPSVLVPTPILTDRTTYSIDRAARHALRHHVKRNPIMRDLIEKLERAAATERRPVSLQ